MRCSRTSNNECIGLGRTTGAVKTARVKRFIIGQYATAIEVEEATEKRITDSSDDFVTVVVETPWSGPR